MKTNQANSPSVSARQHPFLKSALSFALLSLPVAAASPASVNLGTAGDYAILAKTGISVTGTTAIIGDIGVSPAAATYITGLGLIMDPSGTFSTSSLITGNVYASDYTDPTPSRMTTAMGDMQTAYTDAAGRVSPDHTELYAGDITGQTLTPGLYKWSTGVLVSSGGVTIAGTSTDVWIFQIAQNLQVANGAIVTLSGGAKASNVFWQVAGQVTLGTTAAMKGIILCQTAITLSTGATLNGRALAQTAVSLDANVVASPATTATIIRKVSPSREFAHVQNRSSQLIEFTVPSNGRATLSILNARGQSVATLFSGEATTGTNQAQFAVPGLAKGPYMSRLEFAGGVASMQMVLIR